MATARSCVRIESLSKTIQSLLSGLMFFFSLRHQRETKTNGSRKGAKKKTKLAKS